MSTPFVGEIRMFGGNFAPGQWAFCNGQLAAISENEALYTLIGTTYGGDGVQTFGYPDLQGRVPVHMGAGQSTTYVIGQSGGVEQVTIATNTMPGHSHAILSDQNNATTASPANGIPANAVPNLVYTVPNGPANPDSPIFKNLNPAMLAPAGSNLPHDNLQPFQVVSFIICLFGIFPTRN
jgi:microcystin-dependent protein